MGKLKFVYVGCACSVMATSIAVGVIGLLRHPSMLQETEGFRLLAQRTRCAECQWKEDLTAVKCEKCRFFRRHEESPSCTLTEDKKETIKTIIGRRFPEEKWRSETVHSAHEHTSDSVSSLTYLAKNVPRPTAHWTLGSNIHHGENIAVQDWIYETGCDYAHSENGVTLEDGGEMMVDHSGWYLLYIQIDFTGATSNVTQKFGLTVSVNKRGTGHADLLKSRLETKCQVQHNSDSCAVLSKQRIFHLNKNERLSVKVSIPETNRLSTDQSRSYFGVHFVRGS